MSKSKSLANETHIRKRKEIKRVWERARERKIQRETANERKEKYFSN